MSTDLINKVVFTLRLFSNDIITIPADTNLQLTGGGAFSVGNLGHQRGRQYQYRFGPCQF